MGKRDTAVTPMMRQYLETKKENPGTILFFRLGDFYEMFFEDAKLVSKELGLTLTSRSKNPEEAPMCGVPYHAAESYIEDLIKKGYKVAIAEQIGDPKAKGLTKREVIKVVTPGTMMPDSALTDAANNYIALVYEAKERIILSGADISTGECFYAIYEGANRLQSLFDELYRLMLAEILLTPGFCDEKELMEFLALRIPHCAITTLEAVSKNVEDRMVEHFDAANRPADTAASLAIATLLDYLHATLMTDLTHLRSLIRLNASDNLVVDTYTLRNLEITRNLRDGGKKNTLFGVLDFTETPMGTRLLRKWLEYPLRSIPLINRRLVAVKEMVDGFTLRSEIRSTLKDVYDLDRLLTRIEIGTANARDLIALKVSLLSLPHIKKHLVDVNAQALKDVAKGISLFEDMTELLERAIVDDPGLTVREGGIIKPNFNEALDDYRRIAHDSKAMLQKIEEREKKETGIKALKIGYNKVFGYYIEVRNSGTNLVPERYIRKQTLANAERYITEELKDFETKILGAQEKIVNIEYNLFTEIREKIKGVLPKMQETSSEIAKLDVLQGLAEAASRYNYVCPKMLTSGDIVIHDGRHPLVERILTRDLFVPNDTELNHRSDEILLITGPNMAGKSTYMRQTALITLMAQAGSFVPAREAAVTPVDRIFTRIGASDDLVSGQSTFMVEMNEVAQILKYATKDSLVILDEIGRGTSTYDGMSIARAVIEHIEKKIHAKTLFATHYHELTDLEDDKIKNFCIAVKERGHEVAFLRRIVRGSADKSYGIHVARLAGLPKVVTKRAEDILAEMEKNGASSAAAAPAARSKGKKEEAPALSLFTDMLRDELLKVDVMTMTPLEALNELSRLQKQARGEAGIS